MVDLADHPFSPVSVARESGEPDRSEAVWLEWVADAERRLGHDIDGNDVAGEGCGYSLDEAYEKFEAGMSASAFVTMVRGRERYRAPA